MRDADAALEDKDRLLALEKNSLRMIGRSET
jgi:hypothetical protein